MTKEKACSNCVHHEKSGCDLPCSGCCTKGTLQFSFWEPRLFKPEYFSALNWKGAQGLIGREVQFSDDPDEEGWTLPAVLKRLDPESGPRFKMSTAGFMEYIKTCPETYQTPNPTITIDGVELPMPEVAVPEHQTYYWMWKPGLVVKGQWLGYGQAEDWLAAGRIHLTEARAQAWEDWWSDTVVQAMKGA